MKWLFFALLASHASPRSVRGATPRVIRRRSLVSKGGRSLLLSEAPTSDDPTQSPTCVECDDGPEFINTDSVNEFPAVEATSDMPSSMYSDSVMPSTSHSASNMPSESFAPTPSPTCIECDDGPELQNIIAAKTIANEAGVTSEIPSLMPSKSAMPSLSPSISGVPSESLSPSPSGCKEKGSDRGRDSGGIESASPYLLNAPYTSVMPSMVPSINKEKGGKGEKRGRESIPWEPETETSGGAKDFVSSRVSILFLSVGAALIA